MNDESINEIAHTLRIIAMTCKNSDVMSCEFGNEFHDRAVNLLKCSFGLEIK
jgi:hypothetical protein